MANATRRVKEITLDHSGPNNPLPFLIVVAKPTHRKHHKQPSWHTLTESQAQYSSRPMYDAVFT
jgi:hypothetical protein